ncbi:MAG TPA: hypothetical protein VGI49_13030, partial [Mycobacterium sp.]
MGWGVLILEGSFGAVSAKANSVLLQQVSPGGDTPDGLTQLFIGLDDDLIGVPNDLEVGTVDVLTGATVIPASDFEFDFATPATLAGSVTEANPYYADGVALDTTIAALPSTDYADTALENALSTIDQWILP